MYKRQRRKNTESAGKREKKENHEEVISRDIKLHISVTTSNFFSLSSNLFRYQTIQILKTGGHFPSLFRVIKYRLILFL